MRIHTNGIQHVQQISDALNAQKGLGRIARSVRFKVLRAHRSRSHYRAWEIQLEATEPGQGRRAGNSGSYGAMRPEVDGYAATFDEWGWLLAALYDIDPHMLVGTLRTPTYSDGEDFHHKTAWTYSPRALLNSIHHHGDPYPIVTGKAARTKAGYIVGRRGADRTDWNGYRAAWRHEERPRTIDEVIAFAWPNGAFEDIVQRYGAYLTDTTENA